MKYSADIISFWFANQSKCFSKSDQFDDLLKKKFLNAYNEYLNTSYRKEELDIREILALIILFDQFPRNMFRDQSSSYDTDGLALDLSFYVLENELEKVLTEEEKRFIYMPLMHSEDLNLQKKCVSLFKELGHDLAIKSAIEHYKIIEKFGRFPHRNNILSRKSTPEEIKFLESFDSF